MPDFPRPRASVSRSGHLRLLLIAVGVIGTLAAHDTASARRTSAVYELLPEAIVHGHSTAASATYSLGHFVEIFTGTAASAAYTLDRGFLGQISGPDTPGPGTPEISVEHAVGTPLADGATVAFGNAATTGSVTLTLVIRNTGSAPLTGITITKDGFQAAQFTITLLPAATVPAGGSTSFAVRFVPTSLGAKTAALHIANNDADENPFDLTLTGAGVTAVAPVVKALAASNLAFDGATLNGTVDGKGSPRTVFFDYGLTTAYGATVEATPATVQVSPAAAVTAAITGLMPHTKYNFRVRAVGALGSANSANLTFTTSNRAPVTTPDPATLLPGATVTLAVIANDTDPDGDTLTLSAFTAPPTALGKVVKSGNNLVFTASLTFNGGSFNYTAKDAFGASATGTVMLTKGSCDITPPTAAPAALGGSYPITVMATGAWAVAESLTWVTVAPLSGSGDGAVQVQYLDNTAAKSRTGVITIGGKSHGITQAGVLRPTIANPTPPIPVGRVGAPYTLVVPTTNFPLTYAVAKMPPGLTINAKTGVLSGIPTAAGTYAVTVKASNAAGPALTTAAFTIVIDPLPAGVVGTFHGLVPRHLGVNENLGARLELTSTLTAATSGKIVYGAKSFAFKGTLDAVAGAAGAASASATLPIPRTGATPLTLNLQFDSTANSAMGEVFPNGTPGTTVSAWRNVWSTTNKVPAYYRRLHSFTLAQPDPDTDLPEGYGYGSWPTVAETTGLLTVAGKLADGGGFTTGTFVGRQGQVLIYQPLFANKGSAFAVLFVTPHDVAGPKLIGGQMDWLKPPPAATSKDTLYRDGFDSISLSADGGAYVPPAPGDVVMGLPDNTSDNARLSFTLGGLETEGKEFNLTLKVYNPASALVNKADIPPHPNLVKVTTLDAAKGLFAGDFTLPGATTAQNRKVAFLGQIVWGASGQPAGLGYFILPAANTTTAKRRSGRVQFAPAAAAP